MIDPSQENNRNDFYIAHHWQRCPGTSVMSRTPHNPGSWPPLMRAETAAAYCDEVSARQVSYLHPGWRTRRTAATKCFSAECADKFGIFGPGIDRKPPVEARYAVPLKGVEVLAHRMM